MFQTCLSFSVIPTALKPPGGGLGGFLGQTKVSAGTSVRWLV